MVIAVTSKPKHAASTSPPRAELASVWRRTADKALSDRLVTASVGLFVAVTGILVALLENGTSEAVYVALGTLCLTPGCGLTCWLSTKERLARVVTVLGASLTWTIIASAILAWLQIFTLGFLLAVTAGIGGIGSIAFLIAQLVRYLGRLPVSTRAGEGPNFLGQTVVELTPRAKRVAASYRSVMCNLLLVGALMAAAGLLTTAVIQARAHAVGAYGLLPVLGISFLTAAVLTVGVLVVSLRFVHTAWPAAVAALGLLIVEFNGTPMMVAATPLSNWTYKHFGVVDYIVHGGALNNPLDIYQQWPGFFAAAAGLARLSGRGSLSYSNWAQLFFEALNAVVIFAIARRFSHGYRTVPYVAVLLFETANWEGQFYYSPQTTAFLLALLFQFFLLPQLKLGRLRPLFRDRHWLNIGQLEIGERKRAHSLGATIQIAGLIALFGAITITHQMTPYIVLAGIMALWVLGILRSRSIVLALVMTLSAYTFLHLPAIDHNQVFNGFHLNNVAGKQGITSPSPAQSLAGVVAKTISLGFWTATAVCVLSYRRQFGKIAIPTVFATIPLLFALVTNYDGEAIYRVFLFSSPWCALVIAIRLATLARMPMVKWMAVGVWAMFAALGSAQAQDFGMYPMIQVPQGEIIASSYFLDHAPLKATLVLAAANFPSRLNGRYVLHNVVETQNDPALDQSPQFDGKGLDRTSAKDLASSVASLAEGVGYLAVAPSMEHYAAYYGVYPSGTFSTLVSKLLRSPYWQLWYKNDDTFIFRAYPQGRSRDRFSARRSP